MTVRALSIILAGALLGCGGSQTPVPVVGASADISQMAGEWYGEYSSVESGRSGTIAFKLVAGADSATGDVFMTPQMVGRQGAAPGERPMTQPTTTPGIMIRFVRITGGQVSGALAPYPDPTCGCTLHTTFVGRQRADTLEGTYNSVHEQSRETQQGRWRAVRKRP
ncbi:MAG TPA: hypothetical protein VJ816_09325 [Gemmatimonadales bacterium]|nr:hypothetical protein [Gemmatimonadales bacterium]